MPDTNQESWTISPLAVLAESLNFLTANLRLLAVWSVLPLAVWVPLNVSARFINDFGIEDGPAIAILLLCAAVAVWLKVPLMVRLYRKALLGETPTSSYGLQLFNLTTWRYVWACVKITILFSIVGAVLIVVGIMCIVNSMPYWDGMQISASLNMVMFVFGTAIAILMKDVWLAPCMAILFSDVSQGGRMGIFDAHPVMQAAVRARWRIAAVQIVINLPVTALLVMNYIISAIGWTKQHTAVILTMDLALLLVGFAVNLWGASADAVIYQRLKGRLAPAPLEEA